MRSPVFLEWLPHPFASGQEYSASTCCEPPPEEVGRQGWFSSDFATGRAGSTQSPGCSEQGAVAGSHLSSSKGIDPAPN